MGFGPTNGANGFIYALCVHSDVLDTLSQSDGMAYINQSPFYKI